MGICVGSSFASFCTHIQMQISYPNSRKRARKKNIVSLYSHNFIFKHFEFFDSLPLRHADIARRRRRRRRFISLHTRDFVSVLRFYYDILSNETLSTGFFIPRSSHLLFWYEHFWCLIILIKMLFRGRGSGCRKGERKNIFLVVFIWFLHWIYDFARSGFIMHDKRGKPSMRELF